MYPAGVLSWGPGFFVEEPDMPEPCECRNGTRSAWKDQPAKRAGWITTHCRICKRFIGHRPADLKQPKSKNIEREAH